MADDAPVVPIPDGLGDARKDFWRGVTGSFLLGDHELFLERRSSPMGAPRMSRRRTFLASKGHSGNVRKSYANALREQWDARSAWSHFARVVQRLESDEEVVVPAWAVARRIGPRGCAHVRLGVDGSAVPVLPLIVGAEIVTWEPV